MNTKVPVTVLFVLLAAAFAQENYSTWTSYKNVTVNTSSSGANASGNVVNFPLLVRLTSANTDVFSQAASNGADIRFTKLDGVTRLKHQIERFDTATRAAEIWVLMDTVYGNNSSQSIRMYWGKNGAADSSSGSAVFAPGKNFVGVWHMSEATGNVSDATGNGNTGLNTGTTTAAGAVGAGRAFSGTGQWIVVANSANNSALDANIAGNYSVTSWFNAASWTGNPRILQRGGTAPKYGFYDTLNSLQWYTNPTGNSATLRVARPTTNAWHLAQGTYNGAVANIYVDGALLGSASATGSITNSTLAMILGGKTTSADGSGSINPFNGTLDEVRLHSSARDSNWARLDYETQKSGATAVTLGATQPNATVPGAPTGATGVSGNAQVAVSWSAPGSNGGAAITAYTVTSSPGNFTCATTGGTSCTVTGLTNGTAYTFTVTATNVAGTGPASSPSSPVTPVTVLGVPGAPTGVSGTAGNAQVAVSWTAPSSNGGSAITAYTVTSNPDGKTCTTTGALTCIVTTLTNGSPYTFTVTATNSAGIGAASAPSSAVTPAGPPTAPTGVAGIAGNAQVVVSWTAASNGGSAITGYNVVASPGGAICASTGALTCTVTGLTNGTAYTFTVTATNALGTSAASAPSAAVTPVSAPSAPRGVAGTPGSAGQIVVTWVAPSSTGGLTITAYTVTASPGGATCTSTGALTCTITGLADGTAYTLTATATNSAGTGVASAVSGSVTTGLMGFSAQRGFGIHQSGSSVSFRLPATLSGAEVSVMDLRGRTVWSQAAGAGVGELVWNGATSTGRSAHAGVYMVRVTLHQGGQQTSVMETKIVYNR